MAPRLKTLSDQVIVITGATSGIGLATAQEAARRGARVVLAARNKAALKAATQDIRRHGGDATWVVADVSDRGDVQGIADAAIRAFGGFDTWVNNAGVGVFGRLDEVSDDDNRRVFDVNFWGQVYGTQIAAVHLRRKGGAIVNVGSIVSDVGFPIQGMYAASKHAVKGFTNAFRMELMDRGDPISLTLIKPSAIGTPFARHARNYLQHEPKLPPPVYRPESVAAAILDAAEHGGRDTIVGGAGRAISALNKVLPHVVDAAGAWMIPRQSESRRPPTRSPDGNLYDAGSGGAVHGEQSPRLLTQLAAHPAVGTAVLGLLGLAATALLGRTTKGNLR